MMQGKKQYSEKLFKQFQLSDRVPAENFYRLLKQTLDLRWLYKATKKYYGSEGQQSIDPVVFFKLVLIGYLETWVATEESLIQLACGWICYFSSAMILMSHYPGTAL